MSLTDEGHYGPKQLNMLKTVWGEGFLSPGGTEEIDQILKGLNLKNKKVLDIGCGTGGAVFHMIEKYGAKEVIGIDPEPLVIETANNLALKKNLSDKEIVELNKAITHVSNLLGTKDKGYRALTNIGSDGGQEVPHLHFHIFAGEKIGKMVS